MEHEEAPLDVILGDGRARPLGAVSVLLARLDDVPIRRTRLVVPPEIRDAVRHTRDAKAKTSERPAAARDLGRTLGRAPHRIAAV